VHKYCLLWGGRAYALEPASASPQATC
jgi:hypothetical protein